jgi:hypothetical protein
MDRCHPAGGENSRRSLSLGLTPHGRFWLLLSALVFFSGVLSAAATVAAARVPEPQAAYGPPPTPETSVSAQVEQTAAEFDVVTESPASPVTSSSTAESPRIVASSWSMSPLPEGEDGVVISDTEMSPVIGSSMVAANPR